MTNNLTNNNQNQQQNKQGGGLLRRTQQANNNANNNNNNTNSLRSRLANSSLNANNNNNKTPSEPTKPTWTITPMSDAGVKIAFQGLGDPLFRILGTPLDKSLTNIDDFAQKLAEDDDLRQQLIDKLDEAWESYDFCGAVMLHPIRKSIQDSFVMPTLPIIESEQAQDANNNANTANNPSDSPYISPYGTYRSIDALFVLNVLGRVRGNVLVDGTPVALESRFLHQSHISDDPRLVELALATGAIEEAW